MSSHLLPPKLQRRLLVSVGLGVAIYFGLVLYVGFGEVREGFTRLSSSWWVIPAACALAFLNYTVRFWKWEYYRHLLGIRLPRSSSFLIYLSGFVLSVTPGKMGEVFKCYLIKKVDGTPFSRSAPIVVAERFTDLTGYLLLIAIGGLSTLREAWWVFLGTLLLIAGLLVLLFSPRLMHFLIGLTRRRKFIWRFTERLEAAYDSTRTLLAPRHLLMPTLVSMVSWGFECVAFWLILSRFVPLEGAPVPGLLWATFTFAFSAVVGALVLIVPGGLGITESSLGKLLVDKARFARGDATAITLVARACTLWFAVLVGYLALLLFVRRHGSVEAELEAAEEI
jgi:uncharacterized protein (TIRG00374 family)